MKYNKIFRILGIAIVLSLLVIAIPATPALARSVTLVPDEGKIGDRITITGTDFNKSTATVDKYAIIYFSSDEATVLDDIDTKVTHYEIVKDGVWLDEQGAFVENFYVPDILNDGTGSAQNVRSGTYYIYVCHYTTATPPTVVKRIAYVATFTVIGGEITIDPDEGPVGTEVEISGEGFGDREDIFIEYDGKEIEIQSGDEKTDRNGEFGNTIVIIPESTAGDHTITVIGEDSGAEVEATFTVEPEITVSPESGGIGTTVTVSGTGFGKRSDVTIFLDNAKVATKTTDKYGSFDTTFDVPVMEPGIYNVEVGDEDDNEGEAEFTVAIVTDVSISPTTGNIGTEVTVSGTGYTAGRTVTIKYDTAQVATATVKTDGTFSATFTVPKSKYGEHDITTTDGTITKQFTFTMESTAPPIPAPLLPEMGAKAESQAYFDWKDVTDPSGVTYSLQIASDEDFTSIVLEKKDLTDSEYTVTEKEKLKSVSKKAPYYWRVKAIDGASNESGWTGAGSFYVGAVFAMPQWAIYLLFGIGAFLLGIIGFWMGRKTAYSGY